MTMSIERRIADARELLRYCEQLNEAYMLVIEDLSDFAEDEWVFVRTRLETMRADVIGGIQDHRDTIAAVQASCSHAYEKIGEARPPFWRCVRCERTRTDDPGCGRSATL